MLNKYSTTNPKYSTLPTYLDKVRECDRDNLMVEYINKLEQTQNNNDTKYIEPTLSMSVDDILYDDLDEDELNELDELKEEYSDLRKKLNNLKIAKNSTDTTIYWCIIILGYIIAIVFYATELFTVLQTFGIATLLIPICYLMYRIRKKQIIQKYNSTKEALKYIKAQIKDLTK